MATDEKERSEIETGFGTGLRAKLGRPEAEESEPAAAAGTNGSTPPLPGYEESNGELEALRAELAAALERERDLRTELATQAAMPVETLDFGGAGDELKARSADLDRLDDVVARVDLERGLVRPIDLAGYAGVQLAELHRWCVALLGMPPAAYLSAVRFSAYVRERVGTGPVRVGAAVGALRWFMDPSYPPREVERFTGLAPADLRRLVERLERMGLRVSRDRLEKV